MRPGRVLVAEGILDLLGRGPLPEAIGGMSIGADPITAAVVTMSAVRGTPLAGFMVRKEPKGHGTNQYIEGPVQPGDRVAIVEDVVTTGGSSLQAIERAEAFGLKVVQVVAIIDRMEGGAAGVRRPRLSAGQPAEHRRFRHPTAKVGCLEQAGTVPIFVRRKWDCPLGWRSYPSRLTNRP